MVGRDGWLDHSEHKNLAVRINFKNRAAAIAHKKISDGVERDARGNAHAFHPELRAAIRRDAVNRSIIAAGNVKISFAIERQASGIHEFGDKGFYFVVRRNFVERDGYLLAAMTAV